jgi:hypothetical protein
MRSSIIDKRNGELFDQGFLRFEMQSRRIVQKFALSVSKSTIGYWNCDTSAQGSVKNINQSDVSYPTNFP